jgi:hypothetical protein
MVAQKVLQSQNLQLEFAVLFLKSNSVRCLLLALTFNRVFLLFQMQPAVIAGTKQLLQLFVCHGVYSYVWKETNMLLFYSPRVCSSYRNDRYSRKTLEGSIACSLAQSICVF